MKKLVYLAALFLTSAATTVSHADPILWVCDSTGDIGKVNVADGSVTMVGNAGVVLTDIAFNSVGQLFGVSYNNFYSINTTTGLATLVGALGYGQGGMNALTFSSAGVAYAMSGNTSNLYTINTTTGQASIVGNVDNQSAGDLAFNGGSLYLTNDANRLIQITLSPSLSDSDKGRLRTGPMQNVNDAFGLATAGDGVLYGVAGTRIYSVNTSNALLTYKSDFSGHGLGQAYGAAFQPTTAVPEPSSVVMMLAGGLGLAAVARRRRAV